MSALIEPNLHPLVVHFAIAFLITGPLMLLVVALTPADKPWRDGLRSAGDWMFALGVVAALAAIAAGLQAYYTVAHDGPSHAAMTDHRNWAFGTVLAFLVMGGWRYISRADAPSVLFALITLVPVAALGVTGWKGAHLVYGYGLGVASLPEVSGDGHDHDHGDTEPHDHDEPLTEEPPKIEPGSESAPDMHADHVAEPKPVETPPEHDHSTHEH